MTNKKTIGLYQVTIHKPKKIKSLGEQARVRYKFDYWPGTTKKPAMHLFPEWGTKAEPNAKPEYGRGKTLIEHEQSHTNDYLKILENRQPPMSPKHEGYEEYMDHTNKLLDRCTHFHTDGLNKPEDPFWKECKDILEW
jgi:hypothetical protein